MKFRYYIVSVFDGNVRGTNDKAVAEDFAGSCEDFVIDTESNTWLQEDGPVAIKPYEPYKPKGSK